MPLMFNNNKESDNISINESYNESGPAIKDGALNTFKSPLEACTLAGGLNRDLISHLTFHSNEYVHAHLDENNVLCCYKWTNITILKMYHFPKTILNMSLVLSDVNRYWSLWYPATYASLSPTCQFEIKGYHLWYIQGFFKSGQHSIQNVVFIEEETNDNCSLKQGSTKNFHSRKRSVIWWEQCSQRIKV